MRRHCCCTHYNAQWQHSPWIMNGIVLLWGFWYEYTFPLSFIVSVSVVIELNEPWYPGKCPCGNRSVVAGFLRWSALVEPWPTFREGLFLRQLIHIMFMCGYEYSLSICLSVEHRYILANSFSTGKNWSQNCEILETNGFSTKNRDADNKWCYKKNTADNWYLCTACSLNFVKFLWNEPIIE